MEFVAKLSYLIFFHCEIEMDALQMNFDVWTGRAIGETIMTTA